MDSVTLFNWLMKTALYLATAALIGGYFIAWLSRNSNGPERWLQHYSKSAAILGLCSVMLMFALQLIQFSARGWASFYDWELYPILLQSNLGLSLMLAGGGFVVAVLCAVTPKQQVWLVLLRALAVGCVLLSFSFTGHMVSSFWYEKLLLLLHVLAISMWVGALLPLWYLSRYCPADYNVGIMRRFGAIARGFVAVLLIAGALMLLVLLDDIRLLWQSTYGQTMLVKFALVLLLLLLGAINKFVLVPQLSRSNGIKALRISISIEMVIALLVLATTAWATVVIGLHQTASVALITS